MWLKMALSYYMEGKHQGCEASEGVRPLRVTGEGGGQAGVGDVGKRTGETGRALDSTSSVRRAGL